MSNLRISPMCPKCKGNNTYDIIPELPNDPEYQLQAYDVFNSRYTIGNSRYYCIDCDYTWKKYRGKKPYKRIKMIYAEVGGFPGPNYQVVIDLIHRKIEHNRSFYESDTNSDRDLRELKEADKDFSFRAV
ncbi:MAG TPA: hypothetical protein VNM69_18140 [Bacillus sp. (in: firmicutes)]|nr:hypothetical protein [Bacillus sp. (in: firmicutes)]